MKGKGFLHGFLYCMASSMLTIAIIRRVSFLRRMVTPD